MKASTTLIAALKKFEGCSLKAYKDSKGVWTIGYGHTEGVKEGMTITFAEAEARLQLDLRRYEKYVESLGVCKTQGEFDALVDFVYNLGCKSLETSTLLKYIRGGWPATAVQQQFLRWNKSGGKPLQGLTKRRMWEAMRYLGLIP